LPVEAYAISNLHYFLGRRVERLDHQPLPVAGSRCRSVMGDVSVLSAS
jgi:hypothetical protein